MADQSGCPVDHKKVAALPASDGGCPVDHGQVPKPSACPVDHGNGGEGLPPLADIPDNLSAERVVSSIPRSGAEGNWVYPSQQQFYSAMVRKKHDPRAGDMKTVIPIHNAVNEKAWEDIKQWEKGQGAERCGGPKLLRFEGDSSRLTPRARWNMLLGAKRPFDRHDWVVERCGQHIDYVIDFYTGASDPRNPAAAAFYLDVRPKLNSLEGVRLRVARFFGL